MTQLTQLFADKAVAQDAFDDAVREVGESKVRLFEAEAIRVDDLRRNAPEPTVSRRSGSPLYVVQTDYP
jgi:hypothetical protein